jgi:hypothetical protein
MGKQNKTVLHQQTNLKLNSYGIFLLEIWVRVYGYFL